MDGVHPSLDMRVCAHRSHKVFEVGVWACDAGNEVCSHVCDLGIFPFINLMDGLPYGFITERVVKGSHFKSVG